MGEATGLAVDSSFIARCFVLYWGDGMIVPVLFAAALVWILFRRRKSSAVLLAWVTLVLCLTVYNPLLITLIVPRLMEKELYYRCFWLMPVVPGAAYLVTQAAMRIPNRTIRALLAAVVVGFSMFYVQTGHTSAGTIRAAENIYKVPDALIWACEEIHQDFKTCKKEIRAYYRAANGTKKTPKRPCAVFANDLTNYVRQYDPKITLGIRRNTRLLYYGSTVVNGDLTSEKYRRAMVILNQLNGRGSVAVEEFREALTVKKITYIVVHDYSAQGNFMTACGLELVAADYGYEIYRFIPKEEYMTQYSLWAASNEEDT